MNCRYDTDTKTYILPDGEPCRVDEYGDPTNHCTARRTCNQHVGYGELTCARCLGRTRVNLRRLVDLAALYLPAAIEAGRVDREAVNLAGPTAHYGTWEWRDSQRRTEILYAYPEAKAMRYLAQLAEERDDEHHPTLLLARWVLAFAEDYGIDPPKQITLTTAVDWLDRQLGKVAQDENQDWPLFAREVRDCVRHVESVLAMRQTSERGVPCPTCHGEGHSVRLVRLYSHWCDDEACERVHVADESADVWRCPRNRAHQWSPKAYRDYLEERTSA